MSEFIPQNIDEIFGPVVGPNINGSENIQWKKTIVQTVIVSLVIAVPVVTVVIVYSNQQKAEMRRVAQENRLIRQELAELKKSYSIDRET